MEIEQGLADNLPESEEDAREARIRKAIEYFDSGLIGSGFGFSLEQVLEEIRAEGDDKPIAE